RTRSSASGCSAASPGASASRTTWTPRRSRPATTTVCWRSAFRSARRPSRARSRSAPPRPRSWPSNLTPDTQDRRPAGRNAPLAAYHFAWEVRPVEPFDDENVPLYTVGQVAEMLSLKQAFLRRIDELQVVSPQRSAGRQRRYTRVEIRVIQQVATMADA